MRLRRKLPVILLCLLVLTTIFAQVVFAGTYNITQTIGGSWQPAIYITNTNGVSKKTTPFGLSTVATNVTSFTGDYILESDAANGWAVGVYYSSDGSHYTYSGVQLTAQKNVYVPYTINFGSSLKTIRDISFVFESAQGITGVTYTITNPTFTETLTDNTPPSISVSSSTTWGTTNTITANISDSQSGVSATKWASGAQTASWMRSNGTTFYGSSITVSSNGTYTVYASDYAGNEAVSTVTVSHVDITPPSISLSASSTWDISNTITANISDSQSGLYVAKWLYGTWSASYMYANGRVLTSGTVPVSQNGTYTFYARDNVGNETVATINVSHVTNAITVTHPAGVSYTINPNNATFFTAPNISIMNQALIPVSVSVQSLSSVSGGSITLHDVLPSKYSDWTKLTAGQTKSDIALGISVAETTTGGSTWSTINQSAPIYAANITSTVQMGILNPNGAVGNLKFSAYCGLAWDHAYTSMSNLVLVFNAV